MSDTFPNPCFCLDGGEFKRIDFSIASLGQQDALLKEISGSIPTTILGAFTLGDNVCNVQVKGQNFIVWTELDKLEVNTIYAPVASTGEFYPVFKKSAAKDTLETNMTQTWLPNQLKLRLFFVVNFRYDPVRKTYYCESQSCFLIGKKEETTKIIRPPLPNVYDSGALCMGNFNLSEPLLMVAFGKAMTHLHNSQWNNDLLEGLAMEDIRKMFTFKDNKHQPPPARFDIAKVSRCQVINNQVYSDLPL